MFGNRLQTEGAKRGTMWKIIWRKPAAIWILWLVVQLLCGCSAKEEVFTLGQVLEESGPEIVEELSEETEGVNSPFREETIPETIYVHVCGEVCIPGVVSVPAGSRAEEAIAAAGGFTSQADRDYWNLAAVLTDGEQLYIPAIGEVPYQSAGSDTGLVNLNTADLKELCTLPGIGESRAADIIAYREEYGAFEGPEDIMKVSGIKDSTYEKIKDLITVR